MLNIFGNMFASNDEHDLTPEEQEAQAKAERIKFHRERVRNGPVTFSRGMSVERRRRIDARSAARKSRKRQVRRFFEERREEAALRGQLQLAGRLPLDEHATPSPELIENAVAGVMGRIDPALIDDAGLNGDVLWTYFRAQLDSDQARYEELSA